MFQGGEVVTEADVLTVSDGTSFVTAHASGTYKFVTGDVELLAALLDKSGEMREIFCYHFF